MNCRNLQLRFWICSVRRLRHYTTTLMAFNSVPLCLLFFSCLFFVNNKKDAKLGAFSRSSDWNLSRQVVFCYGLKCEFQTSCRNSFFKSKGKVLQAQNYKLCRSFLVKKRKPKCDCVWVFTGTICNCWLLSARFGLPVANVLRFEKKKTTLKKFFTEFFDVI